MTGDSIDTRYAYAQLGLDAGAPFEHIREVLENAVAYRFCTRARMDIIERFVEFFTARTVFGTLESSFVEIRAAYHEQAKTLHPDTNRDNKPAEEQLKVINAAYEVISKVHREAREYYERDVEARYEIEKLAREIRQREGEARRARAGERPRHQSRADRSWADYAARARQAEAAAGARSVPVGPIRYMAASVPRYIRLSRLFYLSRHAIIGSRSMRCSGGRILVYDVIMLPEMEFKRARMNLGIEGQQGSPELTMSRLVPAYIPIDTKTILVPKDEEDPYHFAKDYFLEQFRLVPVGDKGQPASA